MLVYCRALKVEAKSFFDLTITYSKVPEQNGVEIPFSLDKSTGEITPNRQLRYEIDPHQYRIIVTAHEEYSNKQKTVLVRYFHMVILLRIACIIIKPI